MSVQHPLDTILLQAAASPHGLALHTADAHRLHGALYNRLQAHRNEEPFLNLSVARSPRNLDGEVWVLHRTRDRRTKAV